MPRGRIKGTYRHSKKTKEKISVANTGERSSQWKGDNIKYQAIHSWLRRKYGNADRCENKKCLGLSREYQWAKKKGLKYKRKRENFEMLCRSCHKKQDITKETRKKIAESLRKHEGCIVEGCLKKHCAQGYCSHHYNILLRKKHA